MTSRYLLDSDILLDLVNGRDETIDFLDHHLRPGDFSISVVTYAEVYGGVLPSSFPERTRLRIEDVLVSSSVDILPLTREAAKLAGTLFGELVVAGLRTGLSDLLIASTALVHDYPVVTRNVRHYARVAGLKVIAPRSDQGSL